MLLIGLKKSFMTKKSIESKAYKKYNKTFSRAIGLIRLYIIIEKQKKKGSIDYQHTTDLIRSSIVLGVSAMDAYFTDRFCDIVVPYLKKHGPSKDLIQLLEKAGLDVEEALIMASMKRPFWRIKTLVHEYLDTYVTQRFEVIDELFMCFHIKNFSENVKKISKRTTILRSIEKLVQRRHEIVHEGDINDHGRLNKIKPRRIYNRLHNLDKFVSEADAFITKVLRI